MRWHHPLAVQPTPRHPPVRRLPLLRHHRRWPLACYPLPLTAPKLMRQHHPSLQQAQVQRPQPAAAPQTRPQPSEYA